jgi:hypothetical protein
MIFEPENEDDMDGLLECMCVQHEIDHLDGKTILDRKYVNEPIKRGTNAPIKIGRNQKVIVSNGTDTKTVKYKKATQLLEDGWNLQELI